MNRIRLFRKRATVRIVAAAVVAVVASTTGIVTANAFPLNQHLVFHRYTRASACLDADRTAGSTNGAKVQIWACNKDYQQQWVITQKANGWLVVQNGWSGNCLDADLNTIDRATIVQLWSCNGSQQQEWREVVSINGSRALANRLNGKVLDATVDAGNGAQVYLFNPPQDPPDQATLFTIENLG